MFSIKDIIRKYIRVMQVARKPSKDEFVSTTKICALGVLVIGLVGFAVFIAFILLGL
jgi:protein transport protein SEC61 subunit gamma-like protein